MMENLALDLQATKACQRINTLFAVIMFNFIARLLGKKPVYISNTS